MNKWIKKYGQFTFGILFIFYFLYTFSNALENSKEVVIATLLTILTYIQSFVLFFYFYKKRGKPRLQDWMRIALFLLLVLDFMKIVNTVGNQEIIKFSVTTISLVDAPFTMLVIIFAFLSLDLGYWISKTFKVKIKSEQYTIKRKGWIFSILLLSTIIQSYLLFSGVSGYGSSLEYTIGFISLVKTLAGILNPFALVISSYIMFIEKSHNRIYQNVFYGSLLFQVFLGLLSGMKENALIPLLYVVIVFLIAGRKLPKKIIYIGLFVLALLYPVNNSYRNVIKDPYLNTGSSTLNMVLAIRNVFTKPLMETLVGGIESYEYRSSMYPYLQYSIDIEASWNYYKNMTRYTVLPVVWLIPRAIWPDKPRADIGGIFYYEIVGYESNNAVTPTNIGWAYFEGGLLYVTLIFILLGIFFSFIDKANLMNPIVLLFYVLMLHKAIKPEWDPYFMFALVIQTYIMYWVLLKFSGVRKRDVHEE